MPKTFFITGIGTEVGKTIASAIVTEAMVADAPQDDAPGGGMPDMGGMGGMGGMM